MTHSKFPLPAQLERYAKMLQDYRRVWQIPALAVGLLGTLYALFHGSTWQASQALIVRDEAVGELSRVGRFDTNDARKTAQETVLQMARHRQVVSQALTQLTPPDERRATGPREGAIRQLQDSIAVTAPQGAELGQSEVIYLVVKGSSPEDATQRTQAVCDQLDRYLQELRGQRAQGLVLELSERLQVAQGSLTSSTSRLEAMEREVGSDLGELRTLNQSGSGESNLRTGLSQIKNDLRQARSTLTAQQELLELLRSAEDDPKTLVATPTRLLDSQSSLKRLREGLVDAQLRLADLQGKMQNSHPAVKAAQKAEAEIREHLYRELGTAIRGTEADIRVTEALISSHEKQLNDVQKRLDELASVRARYEILVADVQERTNQVKNCQRALAEAQASAEASAKSSLLTRVDRPEVGNGPIGPGRLTIFLGSWVGGLALGCGLVFLVASSGETLRQSVGRRWTDRQSSGIMTGRRSSDRSQPAVDTPANPASAATPDAADTSTGRRAVDRRTTPPIETPPVSSAPTTLQP